jgi:hypothetical protein
MVPASMLKTGIFGHWPIVKLLLENGAHVDVTCGNHYGIGLPATSRIKVEWKVSTAIEAKVGADVEILEHSAVGPNYSRTRVSNTFEDAHVLIGGEVVRIEVEEGIPRFTRDA